VTQGPDAAFRERRARLQRDYEALLARPNTPAGGGNGVYERWQAPILTRDHVPPSWRYDLDPRTNPLLVERIGVNATFNAGAILWQDRFLLVVRVEGNDRKSWFAIAESDTGIDGFRFRARPLALPETADPDTNVYDMRLTRHEDGWVYGLFCTERKDSERPEDTSAAVARCGIARTRNFDDWERLPDLVTRSGQQQRNVVLHPEFVAGRYALYTRPQTGFVDVGAGGGIGFALTDTMQQAGVAEETIVDGRAYHTISELKNGLGPPPIRTAAGWLQLAHGVRATAAGLRYVLYLFMTDLEQPWKVTHKPAGHLIAPLGAERVGDVPNVVFSNGWIANGDEVFIYYASADTRLHVATSSVERLVDYCINTPADGLRSAASVAAVNRLIDGNESVEPE
jgi:4-O-beta-D-mannosyl-D-glucose phosphorylase